MSDSQPHFWDQWSQAYQDFSETIEPYREAQRSFAQGTVAALGENRLLEDLVILDVGGGSGNLIQPLLKALARKRGHLAGVHYILTDGAKEMTQLAQARLEHLKKVFSKVDFQILHADTLGDNFHADVGPARADVVISSWNIEYYPPEKRGEILRRLVALARPEGVVAFSSSVSLPETLSIREVLMPLGQAQVLQALLTGGPAKMKKVIASLKKIAEFGVAVNDLKFPQKPSLDELKELAEQVGLHPVATCYHLFGASGMVVARKDRSKPPALPKTPIAQALSGKKGYEDYPETISFWTYFKFLLQNPPELG